MSGFGEPTVGKQKGVVVTLRHSLHTNLKDDFHEEFATLLGDERHHLAK